MYCDLEKLLKRKRWSAKEIGQALIACEGHKTAKDGQYKEQDLQTILSKVKALKTVSARQETLQYKFIYDFLNQGYNDSLVEATGIEALLQAQLIQVMTRGYHLISNAVDHAAIKDPTAKQLIALTDTLKLKYAEDKDGYAIDHNDPNDLLYYGLPDITIENFSIIKAFNASLPLIAERFEVDAELYYLKAADTIETLANQLNEFLQVILHEERKAVDLSQCEVKPEYIENAKELLKHCVTVEQALQGDNDIISALTNSVG